MEISNMRITYAKNDKNVRFNFIFENLSLYWRTLLRVLNRVKYVDLRVMSGNSELQVSGMLLEDLSVLSNKKLGFIMTLD